jgi:hypothetical protein
MAAKRILVRHPSRMAAHRAAKRDPSGARVATPVTGPDLTGVGAAAAVRAKARVPLRPAVRMSHALMNLARSAKRAARVTVATNRVRGAKKAVIAVNAAAMRAVVVAAVVAADCILVRAVAAVGADPAASASGR